MIAFISLIYASLYLLLFDKLGVFQKSARNISIFAGIGVALVGAIVFTWLTFAPTTKDGRTFQYVVQIVPNVAGPVVEVPARALEQMHKGDVIYQIDQAPFQAAVDQIEASIEQTAAQQRLAEIQYERAKVLVEHSAAAQQDLDTWTARRDEAAAGIANLEAQLDNAHWQLEQTTVRAPYDGYIVNPAVRPGVRVTTAPVAASLPFVSTERFDLFASLSQSAARYVRAGDPVELVFAARPGEVFSGEVRGILNATGEAQLGPSGEIVTASGQPIRGRRPVRVTLHDESLVHELGQGAQAFVAFYTDRGKPVHIITKVVVRMQAWLAYLTNPAG